MRIHTGIAAPIRPMGMLLYVYLLCVPTVAHNRSDSHVCCRRHQGARVAWHTKKWFSLLQTIGRADCCKAV